MQLLDDDGEFLRGKGLVWELLPDGSGYCIVIKDFPVNAAKYNRSSVQLMICVPAGYNDAKLDNFYVDPWLHIKATAAPPHQANVPEKHAGRDWQRFSRHLPTWRAGVDTLRTFWPHIIKELQQPGSQP